MTAPTDSEIQFNGSFILNALTTVEPGNWYIGVRSPETGQVYALLADPTGTGRLQVGGEGSLAITSPTGAVEKMRAADLLVYQAATSRPQQPIEPI